MLVMIMYVCISKMQEIAVHLHLFIVTGLYQAMHLLVLLFEPSFRVNEIELLFHDFLWRLLRDTYYIFSDNHHNWDHKTFFIQLKKIGWRKGELRILGWMRRNQYVLFLILKPRERFDLSKLICNSNHMYLYRVSHRGPSI